MKLGLGIGPLGAPGGERMIELAKEGENLGYDTIWCPKIYGADCFTPLAWVGAHTSKINLGTSIMQISARTPASCCQPSHTPCLVSCAGGWQNCDGQCYLCLQQETLNPSHPSYQSPHSLDSSGKEFL